jgi:uncharacterized RDD family membrane protein YckC
MNGASSDAIHPAGFWIRLVAFAIDLLVIGLTQLVLQLISAARFRTDGTAGPVGFFTLLFAIAYPTVLHAIAGQTVGKLLTRVRVVALDGGAVPLGAAFLRAVVFWAELPLTLGIGQIVGGLRKDKRTFHDLLAGTRAERLPGPMPIRRVRPTPPETTAGEPVAPSSTMPSRSEPRPSG